MINYIFTFFDDADYEDFVSEENSILSTRIIEIEPDNQYDLDNNLIRNEWYVRLEHNTEKDDNLYRHFYRKWRLEKEDELYFIDEVQNRSRKAVQQFEEEPAASTRPPGPPEG